MDLSIIIPCYNETDNIHKLRGELFPVLADLARQSSTEVVFVDDGSQDGTCEELEKLREEFPVGIIFKLEQHPRNQGLGAALRTGFATAQGEVIVTTDSDGTYPFQEIPALLANLKPDIDLVTASPYHPGGGVAGVSGYRLALSRGSSMIYRLFVNWHIHTYTSLFRAYRRAVVQAVPFGSDGFLAGTELMVKAILMGYRVAEYPTVLYSRRNGNSKARIVRTVWAHLGFLYRVGQSRLGNKRIFRTRGLSGYQKWLSTK